MDLVKLRQKSQLTIPKKVREKLGISPGDYLDVKTEGGKVVLTPRFLSSDSKSELSDEGEKRLRESLNQMKKGEITTYGSVDEMVDSLKADD